MYKPLPTLYTVARFSDRYTCPDPRNQFFHDIKSHLWNHQYSKAIVPLNRSWYLEHMKPESTLMCLIAIYIRLFFFGKFCTIYTFDRHYTFNKNLNYFFNFYKIVIKNSNNDMENWSGTYFIHFSSKKALNQVFIPIFHCEKYPPICLLG